jgi:hypothetical protein
MVDRRRSRLSVAVQRRLIEHLVAGTPARLAADLAGIHATEMQLQARTRVADAIATLGGPGSPAGACVWHVVGLETSIAEWARREGWGGRPIGATQGQGVLVCALGVLAAHYGLTRRAA